MTYETDIVGRQRFRASWVFFWTRATQVCARKGGWVMGSGEDEILFCLFLINRRQNLRPCPGIANGRIPRSEGKTRKTRDLSKNPYGEFLRSVSPTINVSIWAFGVPGIPANVGGSSVARIPPSRPRQLITCAPVDNPNSSPSNPANSRDKKPIEIWRDRRGGRGRRGRECS